MIHDDSEDSMQYHHLCVILLLLLMTMIVASSSSLWLSASSYRDNKDRSLMSSFIHKRGLSMQVLAWTDVFYLSLNCLVVVLVNHTPEYCRWNGARVACVPCLLKRNSWFLFRPLSLWRERPIVCATGYLLSEFWFTNEAWIEILSYRYAPMTTLNFHQVENTLLEYHICI